MFGQTKLTSESDTGCWEWRQWMVVELPGITGTQAGRELRPENQVCPVHHLPRLFPPAGREQLALFASWFHFRLNIFIQRATLLPPSPCPWSYMGIAHPSVPAPPTTCLQWSRLLPRGAESLLAPQPAYICVWSCISVSLFSRHSQQQAHVIPHGPHSFVSSFSAYSPRFIPYSLHNALMHQCFSWNRRFKSISCW